ncbi:serine protease [Ktedonobacter sp. SOSP1-52]|uniref:NfeD family protein n=1 Tax=Ktedonobacter sp. SOSP1-52 TaxID=2778366 RepID=UPI001915DB60|nr:nodulation protein NfeD [Ktedonobacter sp. SOSP1-52]GHO67891.1 serine protease [Ktedonobacter sp. SOSP1-52]
MYSRQKRAHWSYWLGAGLLLACALVFQFGTGSSVVLAETRATAHVDRVVLNSDINASSLRLLSRAIESASSDGAHALVVEVDSPGGDLDSMKAMTQKILASTVPVVAYVAPAGGRAASAAAFVTLSAQIAAMSPTTRIGAASPVTSTGGDIESTLKAKITNDLVASMTSIQQRYGRNVSLAVRMVTNASSYDDATAIRSHIVDLGAPNLNSLLTSIDGRQVRLNNGQQVRLQTADVGIQDVSETPADVFYNFLLDPTVIFFLFLVAMLGVYLEVSHPGAIVPGVTGAIALLLFLFGAGSLAPNWAGLALMLLAFVLLVLDVRLPTHGALTIGAVVSLIVGSLIFFNSGGSYNAAYLNPWIIYGAGVVVGLMGLSIVAYAVRVRRAPVRSGQEAMYGAKAVALTPLQPEGRVSYQGENWAALLDVPDLAVDSGTELEIVAVEGLRLRVRPLVTPGVDTGKIAPPLE